MLIVSIGFITVIVSFQVLEVVSGMINERKTLSLVKSAYRKERK